MDDLHRGDFVEFLIRCSRSKMHTLSYYDDQYQNKNICLSVSVYVDSESDVSHYFLSHQMDSNK